MSNAITKDMTIGEVVETHPKAAEVFTSYGLHCVGCHVNAFETVEQGAMGHGMTEEQINKMIEDANKVINEKSDKKAEGELELSDAAVQKIKEYMKKEDNKHVRIQVLPGGCSGLMYHFILTKDTNSDDKVVEIDGAKIVADAESMKMLAGAKIDYEDSLQGAGFTVNNPNAEKSCGCGKSFS